MNTTLVRKVSIYLDEKINHYQITHFTKLDKCHKHHNISRSDEVFWLVKQLTRLREPLPPALAGVTL